MSYAYKWLGLAVLWVALGPIAAAGTARVAVESDGIRPRDVILRPGDSVEWVYLSGTHRIANGVPGTVPGDLFDFDMSNGASTVSETYLAPVEIPYVDQYAGTLQSPIYDQGSISVAAPLFYVDTYHWVNSNFTGTDDHETPQVVQVEPGIWLAIWRGRIGTDFEDIYSSRSVDGGRTWSSPQDVSRYGLDDTAGEHSPCMATNGNGDVIVVWAGNHTLGDAFGADDDIFSARSGDGGQTWQQAVYVNSTAPGDGLDDDDATPRVTWTSNNNAAVVWSSTYNLSGSTGPDPDIFTAVTEDGGASWSSALPAPSAGSSALPDFEPAIASDGAGKVIVVWTREGGDKDLRSIFSSDGGASWSTDAQVNRSADFDIGDDDQPDVAYLGNGNWVAVWRSTESLFGETGNDEDILTATSLTGMAWGQPVPLTLQAYDDGDANDRNPRLCTNNEVGLGLVVWESEDALSASIGGDYDILASTSTDHGHAWAPPHRDECQRRERWCRHRQCPHRRHR